MSRIVEKGRENSKLQRKNNNNKLTEVNNRRGGNDRERPLSEGNKPEDVSKTFPNFSALTESERLIFFEALTTARRNVEKRGVPTRPNFGTVHDEYLKYFTREQKEGKKGFRNEKETSYLTSRDNSASSCDNKSTLKLKPRTFSDGRTRTPTSKTRVTSAKNSTKLLKESGLGDHCEAMIEKNTQKMINLYLKKKERNKPKLSFNVPTAHEKPVKSAGSKPPGLGVKRNAEPEKKPAKNSQAGTVPGTALKVRNTAKFDALNAEEKEIFFRTLQKAHDNIIEKNPEKEKEILPLSAIVERYGADRRVTALYTAPQELQRRNDRERNLRVRLTLTSGDNERLSKARYHSGPVKEFCDRRHKSADSLLVQGNKPKGKLEICDQSDQTDSSLNDPLMASKDSLEIRKKNLSKLNGNNLTTLKQRQFKITQQKQILKWEKMDEKEEKNCEMCLKPHAREKRKAKRKMSINPKRLKTGQASVCEPKNTNVLKKILNKPLLSEKKKIIKDVEVQAKKHSKNKKEKSKKAQEKKKIQKKEEHSEQNVSHELQNVQDRQSMKESNSSDLTEERSKTDSKDCDSEWQTTSAEVQCSEESCQGTCWKSESKQSEKTLNEEECVMACERGEEGETETALEEKEEKVFEVISGPPRSMSTDEEVAPLSSNLNGKKESTIAVREPLLLVDDNACEPEGMKKEIETSRGNSEPLVVETRKEIIADAVVLQEVCTGVSFLDGKTQEGEKIEEIPPCLASGKVVIVDDDSIEKIKKLICYLEAKIQENDHLEEEYFQLLVDYVDYLTKVLESLVLREEQQQKNQVQERSTAAEVHLKLDVSGAHHHKAESAPILEKNFILRLVRNPSLRRAHSETTIAETKGENPNEKHSKRESGEKMQETVDSESSSDAEEENPPTSNDISDKNVLKKNVQLLQVLLHERAGFVEDSVADLTTVRHLDAEDFVPEEKPPMVEFFGEEDDNKQQAHKMKFFKVLRKYFLCSRKKAKKTR